MENEKILFSDLSRNNNSARLASLIPPLTNQVKIRDQNMAKIIILSRMQELTRPMWLTVAYLK